MSEWFIETLNEDLGQRIRIDEVIYKHTTRFQRLLIFKNKLLGKVLTLDGIVQTTEADEFIYHEMLCHVPMIAHGDPRKVLVVGGGDGGTLRQVLKHHSVEKVILVELDSKVIEICQKHLPGLSAGAFEDPRLDLIIGDGYDYVMSTDHSYDIIIVDSPDPVGPAAKLFSSQFYQNCNRILSKTGVLVTQNGVPFVQGAELLNSAHLLSQNFHDVTFYLAAVPTYQGGAMAFGWASNFPELRKISLDELEHRFVKADLTTSYYDPAIHLSCFTTPKWISSLLCNSELQSEGL
ncbi:MAG: spermidine synthase [Rhodospirillaceae bacterium]|nr:spermidine synthase [Rhodospirillaceae bacterium]